MEERMNQLLSATVLQEFMDKIEAKFSIIEAKILNLTSSSTLLPPPLLSQSPKPNLNINGALSLTVVHHVATGPTSPELKQLLTPTKPKRQLSIPPELRQPCPMPAEPKKKKEKENKKKTQKIEEVYHEWTHVKLQQ